MTHCVEALPRPGARAAAACTVHEATRSSAGRAWSRTLVARGVRLVAGLWVFAAGLVLMVRADLGLSAWDVLHDALHRLTPLTFGQVVIAVSVVVLVTSIALGTRPGVGTVANAVLVGTFTDLMLTSGALHDLASGPLLPRVAALLAGIGAIALGTAAYIGANLGAGPRDALMLGISRRTRRSAGAARTAIEASVLVLGVALGGSAGIGTVAFVILIGLAIDVSFRLFGMQPSRAGANAGAVRRGARAVAAWGRRGQLGAASSMETSRETGARV